LTSTCCFVRHNEYWQVIDAGIKESELTTFFYEKMGTATLEDGLYVLESKLADPAFAARMARFLKASFRGWNEAVKNPAEAAKIVVAADTSGKGSEKIQTRQMRSIAGLISTAGTRRIGYLEPSAFERTVSVLQAGGNNSVIRKPPGKAAYTHSVWEAAQK
jgi:NitT/TauT family transport system substrate-binding protein